MRPRDERMRELISLRAFGLSEIEAVRYYVALKMAERGLVSAPNMAVGESFNIGITAVQAGAAAGVAGLGDLAGNGGATPDLAASKRGAQRGHAAARSTDSYVASSANTAPSVG